MNGSTFYTGETTPPPTRRAEPGAGVRKLRTEMGADAFRTAYGTNRNGANAFGKCVSAMARMKTDAARAAAVTRIDAAAARCAKATVTTGKGKGKAKGNVKKQATLVVCLKKSV